MSTQTPAVRQAAQAPSKPTTSAARKDVKSLLEGPLFRVEIAKVLPKHMTAERMIRVALTATMKTPKLLQCTADSLTRCMLDCSALGLEPDGRRAHLIPFEDNRNNVMICTLIIDYKGLVELAMRSGLVSYLYADVVREGDLFEFSLGEIKRHVPWFLRRDEEKPAEAGQDIAVYAYARMSNGSSAVAVMSIDEVYSIRNNSQGWQAFKKGFTKKNPWDPSDWVSEQEMKKKTALRRLCKMVPLSPEFRDAVEKDDASEDPIEKAVNVTPARGPLFHAPQAAAIESTQHDPEPAPAEADNADTASPDPVRQADLQPVEDVKAANYAKIKAKTQTELDAKRQHIADAFVENGINFDAFCQWMGEKRNLQVTVDSFEELDETLVNRIMGNLAGLVRQAKAFVEGGVK